MNNKERGERIRAQILQDVIHYPNNIATHIAKIFSITNQAVYYHLKQLENADRLCSKGKGKGKSYFLGKVRSHSIVLPLMEDLYEDVVWREHFAFIVEGLSENIIDICHYGFTEMVNNAIDHSEGERIFISMSREKENVMIYISDDGEGIFKKIQRLCKLADEKQAILELSKGKLTTDPQNHTGEGIFFTSRIFDKFEIESFGLCFTHDDRFEYDFLEDSDFKMIVSSTIILMKINIFSKRLIKNVFDNFTSDDLQAGNFQFDKTIIPVRLAKYENEKLVSRSQAKRLLLRIERFKHIVFDFEGVSSIGQAFADEIFRVYANKHKHIHLMYINTTKDIENMINRAKSHQ